MDWFWLKFISLCLVIVAVAAGIVWVIVDHQQWLDEQQNKQDRCIAAGGMWIDNRNTEGYCFFNK
ncbi:hypothetical protein SEA_SPARKLEGODDESS_248 [Streptomyces phage SparkleGoddess]|uniref:Uncharacterized protein n=2 Tax=Gilsonvirus comrade TaxID=2846395 RepID=A0A345MEE6_9CAUD|nr:hypothetical protein SEA_SPARKLEGODDESS_248 [Streptomyces phage SparkleGoddess]QQO39901.1 membrane protein [Streptomyces phage Belfort]QZE11813.1 membrane protein [Streptomyces phage Karp]UTN92470.1 hypothetical protein SEA_STIGMA_246 [Streptomyces phage Stigma]